MPMQPLYERKRSWAVVVHYDDSHDTYGPFGTADEARAYAIDRREKEPEDIWKWSLIPLMPPGLTYKQEQELLKKEDEERKVAR